MNFHDVDNLLWVVSINYLHLSVIYSLAKC